MPKNKGLGGKKRRKGKGFTAMTRELVLKSQNQVYGQVVKLTGGDYAKILCFMPESNVEKNGHIPGKMRKRTWLSPGDIVLVSLREFQDDKVDVILKYTPDEIKYLRSDGSIPNQVFDDVDCDIIYAEPDIDAENEDDEHNMVAPQNRRYVIPSDSDSEDLMDELRDL